VNSSTAGEENRRALALVLGAGGTKGWAHVGVLKVLHEAGVPVDLIVGASAGALIGPLYAARRDVAEAERIALSFTAADFLEWFLSDLRLSPRGGRMGRRLWQAYGRLDFAQLAVPFAAVALDLASARPVVLRSGNVARAVEASIRPPLISRPVLHDGLALVDGGLHNTVPVGVARELGAETVVSVNVGEFVVLPHVLRPLSGRVSAACRARSEAPSDVSGQFGFLTGLLSRGRPARAPADIEIRPDMRGTSPMWPWHIGISMRRGEAAARRALPAIRRLLADRAA
jgi:predicted acylesterase/phospholipase RssA